MGIAFPPKSATVGRRTKPVIAAANETGAQAALMSGRERGARMARISRRGRESVLIGDHHLSANRGGRTRCASERRRRTIARSSRLGLREPERDPPKNLQKPKVQRSWTEKTCGYKRLMPLMP